MDYIVLFNSTIFIKTMTLYFNFSQTWVIDMSRSIVFDSLIYIDLIQGLLHFFKRLHGAFPVSAAFLAWSAAFLPEIKPAMIPTIPVMAIDHRLITSLLGSRCSCMAIQKSPSVIMNSKRIVPNAKDMTIQSFISFLLILVTPYLMF